MILPYAVKTCFPFSICTETYPSTGKFRLSGGILGFRIRLETPCPYIDYYQLGEFSAMVVFLSDLLWHPLSVSFERSNEEIRRLMINLSVCSETPLFWTWDNKCSLYREVICVVINNCVESSCIRTVQLVSINGNKSFGGIPLWMWVSWV